MKKTLLAISLCCLALLPKAHAQLMAHAGADTVWCTYGPNPPAPGVGGSPSAMGGTAPYTYQWNALNAPYTYFVSSIVSNPVFSSQPPSNIDSIDYELVVTDAASAIARDTVRVFFSRFMCTLGECIKTKGANDTVTLGLTCFARLLPSTFQWTPAQYISSTTASTPKSWTPTDQIYGTVITDRKGCKANSQCAVVVNGVGVPKVAGTKRTFIIAPNPVTQESVITIGDDYLNGELTVFAADGRLIKRITLSTKATAMGDVLNHKSSGLYFYHYQKEGLPLASGKFLID